MVSANSNLNNAMRAKNDEFYTQLTDIEKEMRYYREHFKDKVIFCNCDDPLESNFFKYFVLNFKFLGLKKVISTHYNRGGKSYTLEVTGDINNDGVINLNDAVKTDLEGDGDFRSDECLKILEQADIVVTNPPFSLFREFVATLVSLEKKFIVIGNNNALTYKEIFPLIKENKLWLGVSPRSMKFIVPVGGVVLVNACWFTNIPHKKRHENLILYKTYYGNESLYPKYDNYDAIEVSKVKDIPKDYEGVMGVPITFLDKFNPEQFVVLGATESEGKGFSCGLWTPESGVAQPLISGVRRYKRIFIKNRAVSK